MDTDFSPDNLGFRREQGYTLLETVVAMAIFVGVMIPLIAVLGNFMLDNSSSQIRGASRAAETEMVTAIASKSFTDATTTVAEDFVVARRAQRTGNLVELNVAVSSTKKPGKTIVMLHKTILSYE